MVSAENAVVGGASNQRIVSCIAEDNGEDPCVVLEEIIAFLQTTEDLADGRRFEMVGGARIGRVRRIRDGDRNHFRRILEIALHDNPFGVARSVDS